MSAIEYIGSEILIASISPFEPIADLRSGSAISTGGSRDHLAVSLLRVRNIIPVVVTRVVSWSRRDAGKQMGGSS
jgi:hypothetical protein